MPSKEEIKKAKETLSNPKKEDLIEIIRIFKRNGIENYCITKNETIETLLQYIDQLEADNYELNNRLNEYIEEREKLNKMINEMAYQLSGLTILDIKKAEYITLGDKKEVKQYYEKKVEEKE